jgi:GNAT superfamily N-acetyltransferase
MFDSIYNILFTIFFILIVLLILIYGYLRAKFGFWALQPVFHIYDIGYFFYKPGIVQHELPEKNKYTNFKNIETLMHTKLSNYQWKKLVDFIQLHYLKNRENVFLPKKENILPYFYGHNGPCFITFYNQEHMLYDTKKEMPITDNKIISIITSRPVHVIIHGQGVDDYPSFDAYYVDYLCVDEKYRKKGIAPQMIQTHNYNQRHLNKKISVCLFKREEELTGIIPLCVYKTYGFQVTTWTKPMELSPFYKWVEINETNFHFLNDFIKLHKTKFDIFIITEITNIMELIKTKNLFIHAILSEETKEFICVYFYRKTCVFVEKNMEVLTCIASINSCHDADLFVQGFKISFWKIAYENHFGFSAVENISDNDMIIQNLIVKTKPFIISPTAYFFYNFIYSTFPADKVFILN